MKAAGTRQRIMEANRYQPSNLEKAKRATRIVSKQGSSQTYKKAGDIVIDSIDKPWHIECDGWF